MTTYLTEAQTAEMLNISARTLQRFRLEGGGPKFCKAGKRVLYAIPDLETWLKEHRHASTSEAKAKGDV
ncbi:helix-turn-helix domain-containing protein [Aliiroseovarius sp. S1123]|uniref:helix-turn-helix domain-containing protein n=1 Tax=Aliiroseovarius sp. S1123 TaxID=2926404 RepID=UPI001FF11E35|nr:helix-turn-helix domain-containing protein [Aliiroseovarius sp. S1123]MCK0172346.1 helix-turn-helix domain-containing protein [Aliiroseovarius sp. S1123]